MSGPVCESHVCGECGGTVRCIGGTFLRNLNGVVEGIEEGYECDDCGHIGKMVSKDEELVRVEGLVCR